ncbi:Lcl C-terminal domain-containing protein [Geofilum sp. OHC36d9]|uniref:Lcl C-terminal domain-containing protein n=1 Tax=Geofilum sp. OHC36d9 TaxID=3458413 RepID=UPI0040333DB7
MGDGSDQRQQHTWTSNRYLVVSEYQNDQVKRDPSFIVNSWTGHIKAMDGARFVRAVRGNPSYGINAFVDNGDSTITDNATGLMWSQNDNGKGLSWQEALAYAESATTAGYEDWRLPNAKELQSIADYSGAFPAMDTTVFNLTELTNIKGQVDYPFYWSSTSNPVEGSDGAVEVGTVYAWVLAAGYNTDPDGNDLHGAGSVVFTPKSEEDFSERDPEIHRYNYVRLVRGGNVTETSNGNPDCINPDRVVSFPEGITSRGGRRGPGHEDVSDREGAPDGEGGPDFSPAVNYLSTIGITGTSEELVAIVAGPPAPSASELVANFAAKKLVVTEVQAQAMLDLLKLR